VKVFSVRVKFLEQHVKSCERLAALLDKLRKGLYRDFTVVGDAPVVKPVKQRSQDPYIPPQKRKVRPVKAERRRQRAARIVEDSVSGNSYLNIVGGKTFTIKDPPPKRDWKKYWYFFRKRGEWKFSEHHPYGDEIDWFTSVESRIVDNPAGFKPPP
jgi:hypothetical protein